MKAAPEWKCWRDPNHSGLITTRFGWPECEDCGAAPAYHERPAFLPDDLTLEVYVPTDPRLEAFIARGSGVVGSAGDADDRTTVYYEGWVNGAAQYADRDARGRWEAGVEHAASRMVTRYPTVACAAPRRDQLKLIGLYHPKTRVITVDNEEALAAWL